VLDNPETQRLLDFSRPIGLLMVAILHFIPDSDQPVEIVHSYREALLGGGYLAMSHFTGDEQAQVGANRGIEWYRQTANPLIIRSKAEVASLLDGIDLVAPGLVWVQQWRPDNSEPELANVSESAIYAGVGRLGA
jgi:hypothetical protein